MAVMVMLLLYPAMHVHPATTFPVLKAGQGAGAHVDTKKGDVVDAVTRPRNKLLQAQPWGTLSPVVLGGHATAVSEEQVEEEM